MIAPVRLAKRLAESVRCSRREAELYITGGWVAVDGVVVEEPQFKVLQQKIELHPEATLAPLDPATFLFHQPPAAIMDTEAALRLIRADTRTTDDPSGIRLLKHHFVRLTPGMPLEANAGGLSVFTQDWRVARKLNIEAASLEQEYVVEVVGELPPDKLELLNCGLRFEGRMPLTAKVSRQNENRLRFALKGAQPGQIALMCKSVGLEVLSMKRIRIGRISMAKLQPGLWRYLMPHERF